MKGNGVVCVLPEPGKPAAASGDPAMPPDGTDISLVSSLGREHNVDGVVVATSPAGIRLKLEAHTQVRFYPWSQIAYTQWEPSMTPIAAADAAATAATDPLMLWKGVACDGEIGQWFAERLRAQGFPAVEKGTAIVRPAQMRDIIEGETGWDGDDAGFGASVGGVPASDDLLWPVDAEGEEGENDEEKEDPGLKVKGQIEIEPAEYGSGAPLCIAALEPEVDLAIWAATTFVPEELSAIFALHEGDFTSYMRQQKMIGDGYLADGDAPAADITCGAHPSGVDMITCRLPPHEGDHEADIEGVGLFWWNEAGQSGEGPSKNWKAIAAPPDEQAPPVEAPSDDPQSLPGQPGEDFPDPGFGGGQTNPDEPGPDDAGLLQ